MNYLLQVILFCEFITNILKHSSKTLSTDRWGIFVHFTNLINHIVFSRLKQPVNLFLNIPFPSYFYIDRSWFYICFLCDFYHQQYNIIKSNQRIHYQALGLFSQPSSTKCYFHPLTPGFMSKWQRGHRLAAAKGLAGKHYFF